ncbi:MAG: hypothetical protein HUJ54_04010 [Erysipelotrichaceae bacterium]|nr:hypothetical protein [Erysipelotrichaceae bacterium]
MKKVFGLAAALLLLWGCVKIPQPVKQTFTLELGEDVYGNPRHYVEDKEADYSDIEVVVHTPGVTKKNNRFVTTGSDFLAVGEYDFALAHGDQEVPFKVKVKDTLPPVPTLSPDRITVSKGAPLNWEEIYQARDLSGVYYEGPAAADFESGENPVKVRIYDRFGNSTYKDIIVEVE